MPARRGASCPELPGHPSDQPTRGGLPPATEPILKRLAGDTQHVVACLIGNARCLRSLSTKPRLQVTGPPVVGSKGQAVVPELGTQILEVAVSTSDRRGWVERCHVVLSSGARNELHQPACYRLLGEGMTGAD